MTSSPPAATDSAPMAVALSTGADELRPTAMPARARRPQTEGNLHSRPRCKRRFISGDAVTDYALFPERHARNQHARFRRYTSNARRGSEQDEGAGSTYRAPPDEGREPLVSHVIGFDIARYRFRERGRGSRGGLRSTSRCRRRSIWHMAPSPSTISCERRRQKLLRPDSLDAAGGGQ